MAFDPRKHIIRPPAAGAPQPPRPYAPPKQEVPITSSRRLLAVPGKIDVVPFTEFPDIVKLDLSKYEGIMPLLRKNINASSDLEEAVNNIILNLLVNSPQKVVKPGKLDYNHFEKQYNHDQLMEYLNAITCIEVLSVYRPRITLGRFDKKETRNGFEKPLPTSKFHIAYFDDIRGNEHLKRCTEIDPCELENTVNALVPKGVLIFNPAEKREIKGMNYIGNFGKVGMYQKARIYLA